MKKIQKWMLVAILTICGTTISAQAQETKHEIGISYGAGANSTLLSILEDLTSITSTAGAIKYGDSKDFGPIAVEYFYHLSPKVGIGGVAAYANTKKDIFIAGSAAGDAKVNYLTVMPAVKLDWFQKEYFGMYSKLAAGVTFRNEKQKCQGAEDVSDSSVIFNWQVSLIGLEVGSQQLRGFAELGMGEQGIILAGLRCKF